MLEKDVLIHKKEALIKGDVNSLRLLSKKGPSKRTLRQAQGPHGSLS